MRRAPAPGSHPKLSAEQLAQLPQVLAQGAEAFGYRGQVWTTKRGADVSKRQLCVSTHSAKCNRILRAKRLRHRSRVLRQCFTRAGCPVEFSLLRSRSVPRKQSLATYRIRT